MANVILSAAGTLLSLLWIVIMIMEKKRYQVIIEEIDGSEYFMKEFFFIGFFLINWLDIDSSSPFMQKKIHKLSEMYGGKKAKELVFIDLAAQISYVMTFLPVGILLAAIMDEILCLFMAAVLIGFLVIYVEYDKNDKLQKRHEQILREFPHVLSQMALLVNAGMTLREALNTAARSGEGILNQEIKSLSDDMANGIPEYEALGRFADRCGVDSVRKFSSLIIQNVKKGSAELAAALMELSGEIWRKRVSSVKEEGERASAKLMLPILIIFAGILIMVVVPMFRNMNF